MDVYLDAVLHPKCIDDEHTFAQEGWHYELEDPKVRGYSRTLLLAAGLAALVPARLPPPLVMLEH